ncbi:MAG: 5-formyltetrahydrofolate cyclo-ligase [Actinomycetaceae bacterium]|nr:5-formyltetrahydrofolate cyclo-ligase [Actinomycetaceae bacterium]MDO5746981.1 5-formyltetrahydrofolate cyclo-ligase [Actinomycetaceae bacterium]
MCHCVKSPDLFDPVEDKKNELRTLIRAQRQRKSTALRNQAEQLICHHLSLLTKPYSVIACYVPFGTEIGLTQFINDEQQKGAQILLPRLGPRLSRAWAWFKSWDDLEESAPGRPLQPRGEVLEAQAVAQAQCVIVPALATDRSGTRLGQGGGWYDRVLSFVEDDIPIVAVHYDEEFFETTYLPSLPHDHPVTISVTPHHVYHVRPHPHD